MGTMAEKPPIPRSKWVEDIPFDYYTSIDDSHDPYEKDGAFVDEADFQRALARAKEMGLKPLTRPEDRPND